MCGIAGFLDPALAGSPGLERLAAAMADSMFHRGPDEGSAYADRDAGLALGFRRLAIIDVSEAGRQPMMSRSGRCIVAFNGEIYSNADLREQLAQHVAGFRGHSDTEALVEACDAWGVEATLPKLIGMFAFALWERDRRRLWLVRDRLGIKPLYWTFQKGTLVFGSELRALRLHPKVETDIDRDALASYFRHGCYPQPHTVYRGIHQLMAGHALCLEAGKPPRIFAYWTLDEIAKSGHASPFRGDDADATTELEELLTDAIRRRMVADVPLGAFLSGGIDSSTVVALMQKCSSRPIRTFSIGFDVPGYNEAEHAKAVATHLGTDHTELYLSPEDALAVIPRLPEIYDEPFADSSQIPTYLVSKLAREHVTVALSGDGGDELFAGYERYHHADLFRRRLDRVPAGLRKTAAAALNAIPAGGLDRLARLMPHRAGVEMTGDRIRKLADVATLAPDAFYKRIVSYWPDPAALVPGAREPSTILSDPAVAAGHPDFIERMQYRDTLTYLPNDILAKVDRASMAVSLEARVPLIDHRLVALAWSLPPHMKIRAGTRKWLLRQVLYRHVPQSMVDRPKMGFGVPIDQWLRGPLRDWAEDLLDQRKLAESGLVDTAFVAERWREHLSGARNWQYGLWTVLMLEAWRRHWHAGGARARTAF